MRTHTKLAALAVVCALMLATGCASTNAATVAVRTVGTTEKSVDLAMKVWGPYARDGKATPAQEQSVRDAYAKYQQVLQAGVVAAHLSKGAETPAELAQVAANVIALIQQITGKPVSFLIRINEEVSHVV